MADTLKITLTKSVDVKIIFMASLMLIDLCIIICIAIWFNEPRTII